MGRLLAGALIVAVLAGAAPAQVPNPTPTPSQEISIDAKSLSYDQKADVVTARGGVVIRRGTTEVHADEVHVNRHTNEVSARGDVSVTDPEGALFADQVDLNLDEETGTIVDGTVTSRRLKYSLSGDRIEKGRGQTYHIVNGKFTTCQCDQGPPSWSIAGQDLQVTLGGYGILSGGTFNVLDVPILYVPRAVFPVNQERQSGFLLPRFSVSNRRGFQALVPFYWAISGSQDATVAADFETGARVGLVGEYRYAFSPDFEGEISPSYFNEFFRGTTETVSNVADPTIPNDRWSVLTEHTNAVGSAKAYADLFLISDDSFLREINTFTFDHRRDTAIRTLPFTTSRFGLVQLWDRSALRVQGTYYQNIAGPQNATLQRLPDAELWGQKIFGDKVLARWDVTGSDFQREQGIDGLRLDVHPEAMIPIHLSPAVFGSVSMGFRETAYHLTEGESYNGLNGVDAGQFVRLPQNTSREIFHVGAEASTSLSRVYQFDRYGIAKLKHSIEPVLAYTFVPGVSQNDLPVFDGVDRDNRRSLFTYGIVSRLLAKAGPADGSPDAVKDPSTAAGPDHGIRELARLSLLQSYDTQREIPPVAGKGAADHFSDVDLGLWVHPRDVLSLRAQATYDTSASDLSSTSIGFQLRDPRYGSDQTAKQLSTRSSIGGTYRFITRGLLQQVDSNLQLRLSDTLGFLYSGRFDVQNSRFLENYFGLRLLSECDCWGFDFAVVDKTNPQEIEVRGQLTLVGLGSTGNGGAKSGSASAW